MAKKKKPDAKQSNLFSFVEKPKSEKNEIKKPVKPSEKKEDVAKKPEPKGEGLKQSTKMPQPKSKKVEDSKIKSPLKEEGSSKKSGEKEKPEPISKTITEAPSKTETKEAPKKVEKSALESPSVFENESDDSEAEGTDGMEGSEEVMEIEDLIEETEEAPEIPEEINAVEIDYKFGLIDDEVKLEKIKGESFSSKYIRFLKKKGQIVQNLDKGLLLDVDYDGGENKAYCKFYDLDAQDIKIWIDTTGHEPYCLSRDTKAALERNVELTNYEGFVRMEEVKKMDLLRDKEIPMTKIYGKSPTSVGGSGTNIRNILGKAWEADIRYHLNYIYDTGIVPGLIYRIKDGKIEKIELQSSVEESKKIVRELKTVFKDDPPEIQEFAEKYLDIFLTNIPDVKRAAMDIEVNVGTNDFMVPDARMANQEVIAVSFVGTDGKKKVFLLEREGFTMGEKSKKFPEDAEMKFFKEEKALLIETFRTMWEYPIIVTFNGDNFDLNYLFHRSLKLKINPELNPIVFKKGFGFMLRAECNLRKGIHIDLFNFFFNRSISGYAFNGAYERASLNDISGALLGREKKKHEEEIQDMTYNALAYYNLKDSILTLELTKFNNSLVWNLIVLLCRMTKMPIHDMIRHQISSWIQNIFYFEHRRKEFLIPRRSEISELKKGGYSKSVIDGKGFQGAYVIPPVPGVHYNVAVMDFASLYPSIIKEYNLSYETVQCSHSDCQDHLIKGIPYYVCTHKTGIFAYIVGFFREIRIKYFKPKSGDKSLPPERRGYYNTIQLALKVFINASYGVFGSKNFPLFCLPVAESTTGIGQYSIKSTINKAEELGIKVLYGDTDSVFLLNPTKDQLKSVTEWAKRELDLDLEQDKVYQFLALSKRKKNYIGILKDSKYADIKGLVGKKKNTPDFIKVIFKQLIEILKNITKDEEFSKARTQIIDIIRDNYKKIGKPDAFSLEDYAIRIALQKNLKDYTKVIPQHVRAATELKGATGKEFQKGEIITFIKSKGVSGSKALELAKFQDIDTKKYQELMMSALEQVLDALGIFADEIKGIKKMDSFF